MKYFQVFGVLLVLCFTGCEKKFAPFLIQARENFLSNNFISTVDNLNVALLHWKESDGTEAKAEAYQLLGQSYQQLRNIDKAMESYNQAILLSTQTFPSAYSLGMLRLTQGQPEPAINAFRKALAMKKDDPLSLLGLATCYYSTRNLKEALATYQKVLDVSPGVRDAMESIAVLKSRLRQKQTSLPLRSKASTYRPAQKPKDPSVNFKKSGKKK